MLKPGIYQPIPLSLFENDKLPSTNLMFVEAPDLLKDPEYLRYINVATTETTILDCGVGASPDLNNPEAHLSRDPHFGVRYLRLACLLKPQVLVIPDSLNESEQTKHNLIDYLSLLKKHDVLRHQALMYVLQGKTTEEALKQVTLTLMHPNIKVIGVPRVCTFFNPKHKDLTGDQYTEARITFIDKLLDLVGSSRQIHMLGMNSIDELRYAGERGLTIDTRWATLYALYDIRITDPRPATRLNVDLTAFISTKMCDSIRQNMHDLIEMYAHYYNPTYIRKESYV